MDDALLTELYKDIPKLGTGSPLVIRQVFEKLDLPPDPTILDIGCATGLTSIELARISGGSIVSLDINQTYLDILKERAAAQRVLDRITIVNQDMHSMHFERGSFDVIWAENIIFGLGIKNALKSWGTLLKQEGYIVFSIIVRMEETAPEEARRYWERVYPSVKSHTEIQDIIQSQGYRVIDTHLVPTEETMDYCYKPLEKRIKELREIYGASREFIAYLALNQEEIDIVRKYGSDFYGSVFYILKY